jgi:hypothetical protein
MYEKAVTATSIFEPLFFDSIVEDLLCWTKAFSHRVLQLNGPPFYKLKQANQANEWLATRPPDHWPSYSTKRQSDRW